MAYEAREGVDYLVNLYQVVGVEQDAEAEMIKGAIKARLLEYHPDRLQGLAPEFQQKGERVTRLLTKANTILLNAERRNEYDGILTSWEGPLSNDGTPTIYMTDHIRAEALLRTPEEIETDFQDTATRTAAMVSHNPKQQAVLGRMLEAAGDEADNDLREAYDQALLAEDRTLGIEQANRSDLIGAAYDDHYRLGHDHAETVRAAIETARVIRAKDFERRALGGVSVRLALLAGESPAPAPSAELLPSKGDLPHYFDEQAKKITDLATKRAAILEKRLEIFRPDYPIAELQTIGHPNFAMGVQQDGQEGFTWLGFSFDSETVTLENVGIPADLKQLLEQADYEQVYAAGFNILSFAIKDQIEHNALLQEAYNKHLLKYFPDAMSDDTDTQA